MLHLACQEKVIPEATTRARVTALAELGISAVELRGKSILADGSSEVAKVLSDAGVSASAICMGYRGALLSDEPSERQRAVDDIRSLLDAAEELGAHGVVVVLATDPYAPVPLRAVDEAQRQRLTDLTLAGLGQLAEHACGMSAKVLLEARNRYESLIVRCLADAAAIVRQLASSHVRILADTFHMNIEETGIVQAISAHADLIGYVQLADNNRLLPGMGSLDFASIFEALVSAGYDGYVSLEAWDLADRRPSRDDLVASLSYLRTCLTNANRSVSGVPAMPAATDITPRHDGQDPRYHDSV